jgi:thioredoxin reductase
MLEPMRQTELLVIGAGPYGLATAAYARQRGIACAIAGRPMSFWKERMPPGMLLRSGFDWHLDAGGNDTLVAFLDEQDIARAEVDPIPVEIFLDYAEWFRRRRGLDVVADAVEGLERREGHFVARFRGGGKVAAAAVVAAPGLRYFAHVPRDHPVVALAADRWSHTCDLTRFEALSGHRLLIVGGRQSAFEWAALAAESGAAEVHISYRHETPRFEVSDWSFVDPMIDGSIETRGWFRRLPASERESINRRFWAEGRLKLEPWLTPRLEGAPIRLWPRTTVTTCGVTQTGAIHAVLDGETPLEVDHVVLATGYRVDIARVPYLRDLLSELETVEGYPVLNESFESSVPGLFLAGLVAARDFGPFLGFVRGCPLAARLIVEALGKRETSAPRAL